MDKAVKNGTCTEDSHSNTEIKDKCSSSICTVTPAQGYVTGLKGVTVNSVEALMTAVLTQQIVSVVIRADSVPFQLYSSGDMQSFGAARNSTMKFFQSVGALTAARIIGKVRPSPMLVVQRADADGSRSGRRRRCHSMNAQRQRAGDSVREGQVPNSTTKPEFKCVLAVMNNDQEVSGIQDALAPAIMKFRMKCRITDLMNQLQAEASTETDQVKLR